MTRRHRLIVNIIGAIVAIFIVGPIVWMSFDRTPAYSVNSIKVDNSSMAATGEAISLVWNINVNRSGCGGQYERQIVDSAGIVRAYLPHPATFVYLPIGPQTPKSAHPLVIPEMADGPAQFRVHVETWCNFIQRIFPVSYTVIVPFVKYGSMPGPSLPLKNSEAPDGQ